MNRYVYIPLVAVLASCAVFKGGKKKTAKTSASQTVQPPAVGKNGVKPYSNVVTPGMITQKGLITVHSTPERDTILLEIDKQLLGRDMLALTYLKKISRDIGIYPGEELDDKAVFFEKGTNDRILLKRRITLADAAPGDIISKAVEGANNNPVMATFPIAAYGKDSGSYVIDITGLFKDGNSFLNNYDNENFTRKMMVNMGTDHNVEDIRTFPTNIMFSFSRTSSVKMNDTASLIPCALETSISLLLLPEQPMARRIKDPRVGYFEIQSLNFQDTVHHVNNLSFVKRWRMEPKPEDVEKYMRGELVEPAKPIVIYIDPATPKQWRSFLIQGVNDWQPAFEQAGFKNAISAKEWPENDSTFDKEDVRYSFLCYLPSKLENAYGPSFVDPRSGEIVQTRIGWYHNIAGLLNSWYKIQVGVNDKRAQQDKLDTELMGQLIRFVSSHEIGHTLGLSHNFGSSSQTPVDSLRSITFLKKYGHTASIMDYARFNYAAQPQDNIPPELLFPRIGDYDKWAIEWGYKYFDKKDVNAERNILFDMTTKRLAANNRLYFGDGERKEDPDPRNLTEDLSDNVAVADSLGFANFRIVMKNMLKWTYNESNPELSAFKFYDKLVGTFMTSMFHMLPNITLNYTDIKTTDSQDPAYRPVPKSLQLQSLRFVCRELLEDYAWIDDPEIINHFFIPLTESFIKDMQRKAMCLFVSPEVLGSIYINEVRFGKENTLSMQEYIDELHNSVWKNMKSVDSDHRNIQRSYVNSLLDILVVNGEMENSDIIAVTNGELNKLIAMIKKSMPLADSQTKDHLLDLQERIYRLTKKS
ncbi:DUF5117 domain-containing protein [Chitinophaga silvatica]|uniref:DUF5117 domain-containing protein n=1 Tax=Chitinophaga silvatica TaxID=2282649 RepID=A0A3E1YGV0_9BACT|nr:zinc-dependent metalloprotease [Chitinophaga silvatica]RFS26606.1 DUF5117 domain-containing protein [Chitinophaga silvatica]